jgi:hypothetical protein
LYTVFIDQCDDIQDIGGILDYSSLTTIFHLPLISDSINQDQEIYINSTATIGTVVSLLNQTDDFDPDLNIVPGVGKPFAYATLVLGSVE